VGKTVAMLEEGRRRLTRGTDVVVAFAQAHDRPYTERCLEGLPTVAWSDDAATVLERAPELALVDEFETHWRAVESLLDAGIHVVTTLDIAHLVSLRDVVERITGSQQRAAVPDAVVRAADQIELVDMTPEALRRRMAHGNIYPAEMIDAALANYFRPGNLTALRELALLWLADSVEEGLQRYRDEHGISETWETKERIVVALTGGPEGDALIRRASRIAARTLGSELLAVHVSRSDDLVEPGVARLTGQRLLVEQLGGSYHSVVGDDVPHALLDFARRVDATQIVLGASRHHPLWGALTGRGTGVTVTRHAGPVDVHLVGHPYAGRAGLPLPSLTGGLTVRRRVGGLLVALVLLPLLTIVAANLRHRVAFGADVPLYLLVVVLTSLVGGFYPALFAGVAASLLLNYYFVEPLHTFTIDEASNIIALAIFLIIATLVSHVVDLAARRSRQAARASAEAETLSTFAGSLLRGEQALGALLDRVRETFAVDSASLLRNEGPDDWEIVASSGAEAPTRPAQAESVATVGDDLTLALRGRVLSAEDQHVLTAFAAHVAVAYRQRQLAAAARAIEPLAESDRQRTALLNAVSHDLRTPIAAAKAAISSLRDRDVSWNDADRGELLATAEQAMDRLAELITNLLDLSRLRADALPVLCARVGIDDIVARALEHVAAGRELVVDVAADLPEVVVDAGLLERVVANVVQNALRYTPPGVPVRLAGSAYGEFVELRVIDRGPGIPRAALEAVFEPFQRSDDAPSNGDGVGLGLAIARGLTEAMGGSVHAEETPGGGATVVIAVRAATAESVEAMSWQ
jgi:two-component system sensor histidine kinase KdpD